MALKITKHPRGPELPVELKTRLFRSFTDAANWADDNNLKPGIYFIKNTSGATLATIRELHYYHEGTGFWVEGRGNI